MKTYFFINFVSTCYVPVWKVSLHRDPVLSRKNTNLLCEQVQAIKECCRERENIIHEAVSNFRIPTSIDNKQIILFSNIFVAIIIFNITAISSVSCWSRRVKY
jgi:hypothetical protein